MKVHSRKQFVSNEDQAVAWETAPAVGLATRGVWDQPSSDDKLIGRTHFTYASISRQVLELCQNCGKCSMRRFSHFVQHLNGLSMCLCRIRTQCDQPILETSTSRSFYLSMCKCTILIVLTTDRLSFYHPAMPTSPSRYRKLFAAWRHYPGSIT